MALTRVVDDLALSKEILQAVADDLSADRFRSANLQLRQHTADGARIMVPGDRHEEPQHAGCAASSSAAIDDVHRVQVWAGKFAAEKKCDGSIIPRSCSPRCCENNKAPWRGRW